MSKKIWVLVVATLLLIPFTYLFYSLNQMQHVRIDKTAQALGISQEKEYNSEIMDGVVNIAVFGLDRYEQDYNGRSDSIIIVTIDFDHKTIKMSSIMRDLLVPIEGHGEDKINHAYSYGGPQLALKTINQNLGTKVSDFVTADFRTLAEATNALGGITIDVLEHEKIIINDYMEDEAKYIVKSGPQLLDGEQIVAYASNRKFDNDFERIERQKQVVLAILNKVQEKGSAGLPGYIVAMLPFVETSLDKTTMLNLGVNCFQQKVDTLEHQRFPQDGCWQSVNIAGVYYLKTDLAVTKQHLNDFIFEQ